MTCLIVSLCLGRSAVLVVTDVLLSLGDWVL